MTRINTIPPELMFDEWVAAHLREGLRPINKLKEGKYTSEPITNGDYRLNKGHELWCAGHCFFTMKQWLSYKVEWDKRGFKGFDFNPSLGGIESKYVKGYTPTKKDHRTNLARLCERFRKRSNPYHYKGNVINNNKEFLKWVSYVKKELCL